MKVMGRAPGRSNSDVINRRLHLRTKRLYREKVPVIVSTSGRNGRRPDLPTLSDLVGYLFA